MPQIESDRNFSFSSVIVACPDSEGEIRTGNEIKGENFIIVRILGASSESKSFVVGDELFDGQVYTVKRV